MSHFSVHSFSLFFFSFCNTSSGHDMLLCFTILFTFTSVRGTCCFQFHLSVPSFAGATSTVAMEEGEDCKKEESEEEEDEEMSDNNT